MRATWAASRPRTWPSASTTYQSRVTSHARGENVRLAGERMRATPLRFGSVAPGTSCPAAASSEPTFKASGDQAVRSTSDRGQDLPGGGEDGDRAGGWGWLAVEAAGHVGDHRGRRAAEAGQVSWEAAVPGQVAGQPGLGDPGRDDQHVEQAVADVGVREQPAPAAEGAAVADDHGQGLALDHPAVDLDPGRPGRRVDPGPDPTDQVGGRAEGLLDPARQHVGGGGREPGVDAVGGPPRPAVEQVEGTGAGPL